MVPVGQEALQDRLRLFPRRPGRAGLPLWALSAAPYTNGKRNDSRDTFHIHAHTLCSDAPLFIHIRQVPNEFERGYAVVIAGDSFAVDDAGTRAQAGQRLDD
jgi:hypothetical protein